MTVDMENKIAVQTREPNAVQKVIFGVLRFLIVLAILAGAVGAAYYLFLTKPETHKGERAVLPTLVEAEAVKSKNYQVFVEAFGTVEAARAIDLLPEVSGKVLKVNENLVPGGMIHKGEVVVKIDPKDYELVLQQQKANLTQNESSYAIEQGRQDIAKHELELLEEKTSPREKNLVLRMPQLQQAEAKVKTAEAAVEQAKINLDRTTVTMPFNAVVRKKQADVGMLARQGSAVASVVGVDEFWIRVLVPTNQLKWIFKGEECGGKVKVFNEFAWGEVWREGVVKQLNSELDSSARMAQVIVSVKDPLGYEAKDKPVPKLLLGMYTKTMIGGPLLEDVFVLPRDDIHDNNTIWVIGKDDKLDIREVMPIWEDDDYAVLREGLEEGEVLVTSQIITPVEGMKLKIAK